MMMLMMMMAILGAVRQLELCPDTTVARTLAKMAEDYLRGDKSSSDRSRENVCILVSGPIDQKSNEELEHLHSELLKEIDACMVAYFSFHWKHASAIIDQVVSNGVEQKRLRKAVWLATRVDIVGLPLVGLCAAGIKLQILLCTQCGPSNSKPA
jgi:hypothetical protein